MTVLVTGANGFVGRALCSRLGDSGTPYRESVRHREGAADGRDCFVTGPLETPVNWTPALEGVSEIVHLAARVHVMNEVSADPLAEFRKVNVAATCALAHQAASAGVRRFVYVSSVKVNGEASAVGQPFVASQPPSPQDAYGLSKWEAECRLWEIARETGLEVVVIRPPLVYGPGVRANFETMMRWVGRGVPLPFACLTANRRSLVAVETLVDLIVTCLTHPSAAGETFLVSDGDDLSTADLLRRLGQAMGVPARLFPVPSIVLQTAAFLVGKQALYQRLAGSLQVDISDTCSRLDWKPVLSVEEALRRTVESRRGPLR